MNEQKSSLSRLCFKYCSNLKGQYILPKTKNVLRSLQFNILISFTVCISSCTVRQSTSKQIQVDRQVSRVTTVLKGATVIDGTGSGPVFGATIAIAGNQIVYVGDSVNAPVSPLAKVVNLTGRWVVPGFVDMHAHLPRKKTIESYLSKLIAFGTTTLRAPSNPQVDLRDSIAMGYLVGPQIFLACQLINGKEAPFGQRADTEMEIRELVRAETKRGVDFIKLYVGVTPDLAAAAIDEAHQHGLGVIGHLGKTTWTEAAELGIDALTHSWYAGLAHSVVPEQYKEEFQGFYIPGPFDPQLFKKWRQIVDPNGPEVAYLASLLKEKGIVVDPNLVHGEAVSWGDDQRVLERLEPDFAGFQTATKWRGNRHPYSSGWSEEGLAEAKLAFPIMVDIIRVFHERGVLLTIGTDYLNPWMTPGVAFHRELEILVSAGIPALDVLQMATKNGAEALGILEETGTIEVGKRADLVVLTADPLAAIANTRKIERVFLRGKSYFPEQLLK